MERANVNGAQLEYDVTGSGDPVVFVHGAHLADAHLPLAAEPALGSFTRIRYHRRGHGGSTRAGGPVSVEQHAADAAALLRHLGVERAHIVGHSSGAIVALGLALGESEAVASLALLEPPSLTAPGADAFFTGLEQCMALYGGGDPEAAVAMFLTAVFGMGRDTWERLLDQRVPGGFAQAVKDADTFFTSELPGVSGWTFGPDEGARVRQPSLFVLGAESEPWFVASYHQYRSWLPSLDTVRIEDAGHALQMQQPKAVATALADFFERHPVGGT